MGGYLFVHFREKRTPDGEQIYFGLSRDGLRWSQVNEGRPVLWSMIGERGVRDATVVRHRDGRYFIIATDLSLSYSMASRYHNSWAELSRNGSQCLSVWETKDLIHFEPQRLIDFSGNGFGCLWAPDVFAPGPDQRYVLHWSSPIPGGGGKKAIYYAETDDFLSFSRPSILYEKESGTVIDSALYRQGDWCYLFVKSEKDPEAVILLRSRDWRGPYERMPAFDEEMARLQAGTYEAPTAFRAPDGRWYLFLDYYGVPGRGQGYVPFVADDLSTGRFVRSDRAFSFPYGFKHGTVIPIDDQTYANLGKLLIEE